MIVRIAMYIQRRTTMRFQYICAIRPKLNSNAASRPRGKICILYSPHLAWHRRIPRRSLTFTRTPSRNAPTTHNSSNHLGRWQDADNAGYSVVWRARTHILRASLYTQLADILAETMRVLTCPGELQCLLPDSARPLACRSLHVSRRIM